MRHFVLIDHSVQDTTGHHYEYAMRVLEAARDAGYTPVLGANLHFRPQVQPEFRVDAVYPDGFWPRMAASHKPGWIADAIEAGKRALARLRYRARFSLWGFLWLIRNEPFAYLRYHPFDSPVGQAVLVLVGGPVWLARWVTGMVAALLPFRKYWSGAASSIWEPPAQLAKRLVDAVSSSGAMAGFRFARQKEKSFGAATLRLLRSLPLGPEDIIFVPTLAEPEMLGLLRAFAEHKESSLPSYHLLFRRNLYHGREPDFDHQAADILPIRNAFLRFRAATGDRRVFLHTDTEELSAQFNRLRIFPFGTCPIPHTTPAPSESPATEPLQVTYLGDARIEKGYHLLPGMVQDLWQSHVRTGRVRFAFQSNYNVEPGEPEAIVARSQLRAFPPDKVRLILKTCSSSEYRELLLSASVVVLPYDATQYYARSSGVLVEALAAGIPVVVPATSWLAKQIADPAHRYVTNLIRSRAVPQKRYSWLRERPVKFAAERNPETLSFGGEYAKAYAWTSPPRGARGIAISLRFQGRPGEFVKCYVDQIDAHGRRVAFNVKLLGSGYLDDTAAVAVRLHPNTDRVWVALRNAFSDDLMRVHDPAIRYLGDGPGGESFPLSAVGVTFGEATSQGLTRAVREVLAHYGHYRDTARAQSGSVYQFHNATNLISTLEKTAGSAEPAAVLEPCVAER